MIQILSRHDYHSHLSLMNKNTKHDNLGASVAFSPTSKSQCAFAFRSFELRICPRGLHFVNGVKQYPKVFFIRKPNFVN